MPPVTWSCPNCGRRVPLRVSQCHCGTTREDAEQQAAAQGTAAAGSRVPRPRARPAGPPLRIGPLSWDLKALLVGIVVVTLLGIVRLFWPSPAERVVPVLGHIDAPRPTPRPTPTATGWKLPWK